MKIKSTLLNCGLAVALTTGSVFAQEEAATEEKQSLTEKYPWTKNIYVSGSLGSNLATTDIKQYNNWPVVNYSSEWAMGFAANWGYSLSKTVAIEGGGFLGRGRGTERSQSLHFRSDFRELTLGLNVDLSNLFFTSRKDEKRYSFYSKGGLGFSYAKGNLYKLAVENQYDDANIISNSEFNGEFQKAGIGYLGGGFTYKLNKNLDVFVETTFRFTDSDRLDGLSSRNDNDRYVYNAVGLTYRLGNQKWTRPQEEFINKISILDSIMNGMQDSDDDGVLDLVDKEANSAKGAKVYGDGSVVDTDGDGVPDHLDQQKLSPCAEVDEYGVSLDSDEDGVADCLDLEPNTEKGASVDVKGRKIELKTKTETTKSITFDPVFFETNSTSLDNDAKRSLIQVVKYLNDNPSAKLELVGHTDATGSNMINEKLASSRAKAVAYYLTNVYGIDASRLTTVSKGDQEPLAKGKKAKENRRVDINIK